jgi:3-phosphoshikimate 1-carboxyvinyltransferase
VTVGGGDGLTGSDITVPMASAQVRSAVELAAVQADGESTVDSPAGFRDHTERWFETLGLGSWETGTRFRVHPGEVPTNNYRIPGDPSSAAFLWASAAICKDGAVTTRDVSLNPGRIGFLQILEMMGARIEAEVTRAILGDPVGNVTVHGGPLRGVRVDGDLVAAALDELPLVAVLGSFAEGVTEVADAAELRGKESDRIATSCEMIRALGGGAEESEDGFQIVGLGWLEGGTVDSHTDHRIAMAAGVAATGATGQVRVERADAAAVSWPDFYDTLDEMWSST